MNNMMKLINAYDSIVPNVETLLTDEFKNHVDKNFPPGSIKPFKTAMITGYFVRCAENILAEIKPKVPDQKIKDILDSKISKVTKIKDIANYLDDHDKLGLQDKVSDYSLFPFKDVKLFLEGVTEDLIKSTLEAYELPENMTRDYIDEMIYRNTAFGYLYKLSEEIVLLEK